MAGGWRKTLLNSAAILERSVQKCAEVSKSVLGTCWEVCTSVEKCAQVWRSAQTCWKHCLAVFFSNPQYSGWNRYRLGNRSDTIGWSWPTDPIVRSLTDSGQRVRVSKTKEKRVRVSKKLAQNWLLLLVSPRQPQILLTVGLSPFKDSLLGLF